MNKTFKTIIDKSCDFINGFIEDVQENPRIYITSAIAYILGKHSGKKAELDRINRTYREKYYDTDGNFVGSEPTLKWKERAMKNNWVTIDFDNREEGKIALEAVKKYKESLTKDSD